MRPLDGIRVVDFTEGAQGPYAASLLGDLGAEVVKIERPDGELMRRAGPFRNGLALPILSLARSRHAALALDLKQEADRATAKRLIGVADMMLQNWKPGTDAKLGLAFHQVRLFSPNIVYVQASGYGSRGPFGAMGAMDSLSQAFSGMWTLSGDPKGSGERARSPILDFVSAFVTAEAAMIGLTARRKHGRATLVDTSQMSAAMDASAPEVATAARQRVAPAGRSSRYLPLGGWFACADGTFVSLECRDDSEVAAAARAFGIDTDQAIGPAIERVFAARESAGVLALLKDAGLNAYRVERRFTPGLFDPHPGVVNTQHDDAAGEIVHPEAPILMSATPPRAGQTLGAIGRDNPLIERLIAQWGERMQAPPQKD